MNRSDFATRALMLAVLVSVIVGLSLLIPHLRAQRFTPIVLEQTDSSEDSEVFVHLSGAVAHPGLYTLDASASLAHVLSLAAADMNEESHTVSIVVDPPRNPGGSQKVDLNHADEWLLVALPGIGPDRAKAIIAYRELHGLFACTEELTLVPGIGGATYDALRELVTVAP